MPGVVATAEAFMAPSTSWRERIDPGEQDLFERFARDITGYQKEDAGSGKPLRGFHAKIHAGLIGEFQVLDGLLEHERQGVFSTPKIFPAVVRFSNGESTIKEDTNQEPRG